MRLLAGDDAMARIQHSAMVSAMLLLPCFDATAQRCRVLVDDVDVV